MLDMLPAILSCAPDDVPVVFKNLHWPRTLKVGIDFDLFARFLHESISLGDPLRCAACDHDCMHLRRIETFADQADLRAMVERKQCHALTAVELTRHDGRTFLNTSAWFTEADPAP
jgi:hypothetical protein